MPTSEEYEKLKKQVLTESDYTKVLLDKYLTEKDLIRKKKLEELLQQVLDETELDIEKLKIATAVESL